MIMRIRCPCGKNLADVASPRRINMDRDRLPADWLTVTPRPGVHQQRTDTGTYVWRCPRSRCRPWQRTPEKISAGYGITMRRWRKQHVHRHGPSAAVLDRDL